MFRPLRPATQLLRRAFRKRHSHGEQGCADGDGKQCVASVWKIQPGIHLRHRRLLERRYELGRFRHRNPEDGSDRDSPGGDVSDHLLDPTLAAFNYSFTYIPATLTVGKAPLTVTANSVSRIHGAANPALTYTIKGYLNSDTSAVISGTALLTTTAVPASVAGPYPITFFTETLTASNYSFTYFNGTLTVTAANPAILLA